MIWPSHGPHVEASRARVPEDTRIYAIGDIHGRLDLLNEILARVDADIAMHPAPNTIRVFLGDYIDRGPDSKCVLDRLISYRVAQPTVCLMGNHEAYLREFLEKFGYSYSLETLGRTKYPVVIWTNPDVRDRRPRAARTRV